MSVQTFSPSDVQVTMTDAAIEHVREQIEKHGAAGMHLGVRESGCTGYMYEIHFVKDADPEHKKFEMADDVTVYVDSPSLPYVQGTEIDYVTEGLNRSIRFNNPNIKAQCGCGESFSV